MMIALHLSPAKLKECHLRDYMAAAEPIFANKNVTEAMCSRDIRRCFYGYFQLAPTARPPAQLVCIHIHTCSAAVVS